MPKFGMGASWNGGFESGVPLGQPAASQANASKKQKMKGKTFTALVVVGGLTVGNVWANGFRIDANLRDFADLRKDLTAEDLRVGEKGILSTYFSACLKDGLLHLINPVLVTKVSEYSPTLDITRLPGNGVSITENPKSQREITSYELLSRFIGRRDCAEYIAQGESVFLVKDIFEKKSLKELASYFRNKSVASKNARSPKVKTVETKSGTTKFSDKNKWMVSEGKSKIDDSPSVTMLLPTKDDQELTLVVRCVENSTDLYLAGTGFLPSSDDRDGRSKGTIRIDSEKPFNVRMSRSTDRKALFFPRPIHHLKRLVKANQMTVRYRASRRRVIATFDLEGMKDGMTKLRKACNW